MAQILQLSKILFLQPYGNFQSEKLELNQRNHKVSQLIKTLGQLFRRVATFLPSLPDMNEVPACSAVTAYDHHQASSTAARLAQFD